MNILRQFGFVLMCVLSNSFGYDIKCPDSSQWKPRAIQKCLYRPSTIYLCLWDLIDSTYKEHCGQKEVSKLGYKYVLMPNPQQVSCSNTFFQPFKFTSDGNSRCVFPKSECSEEGQVVANNGTSTTDRSCRCDYTRGYAFVTTPKNKCTCIPSLEDCSCYYKQCSGQNEIMIRDYTCKIIEEDILPETIPCENIVISGTNPEINIKIEVIETINRFQVVKWNTSLVIGVIIFIVLLKIVVCLCIALFIYVRPRVTFDHITSSWSLTESRNCNKCTVLDGDTISLVFKVYTQFTIKSIKVFRTQSDNMNVQKQIQNAIVKRENNEIILDIDNLTAKESGTYICIVENSTGVSNTSLNAIWEFFGGTQIQKSCITIDVFSSEENEHTVTDYSGRNVILLNAENKIQNTNIKDVTWIRKVNKKYVCVPVKDSNKYRGGTKEQLSLTIMKCNTSDTGVYMCISTDSKDNIIKSCSFKITLILKDKGKDAILKHRKDKTFVRTSVIDKILLCMEICSIIIISGREGSGKSKICLEIASDYDKMDFALYEIENLREDIQLDDCKTLVLINIDRLEGNDLDLLKQLVCRSLQYKFLLKCRFHLLDVLKDNLKGYKSFHWKLDFCLSIGEKRKMLKQHMEVNDIVRISSLDIDCHDKCDDSSIKALDEYTFEAIVKSEPWIGFPKCVSLFCSDIQLLGQEDSYFLTPPEPIKNCVKALYNRASVQTDLDNKHRFCVLVYILQNTIHKLSFSKFDEEEYCSIWKKIFNKNSCIGNNCLPDLVLNAAKSMKDEFLRCNGDSYEFINPCLIAVVVMAAPNMLLQDFLSKAPLVDVIDYASKQMLESAYDFLDGHYHTILFKRLESEFLNDSTKNTCFGKYIYRKWIKQRDLRMKTEILTYTTYIIYTKKQEHMLLWDVVSLVEEITLTGRDPWLYKDKVSDAIVFLGLIVAAKGNYFAKRKEAFGIIFSQFKNKLNEKKEVFLKAMNSELDTKGNTFLHYMVLFGVTEAVVVIDAIFTKKLKELNRKFDDIYIKALEIAAHLGKVLVLKIFLVKTKYVKKHKDRLLLASQTGTEEQSVLYTNQGKFDFDTDGCRSIFRISDIFEKDVLRCVSWGTGDDFLAIVMLLKTKKLNDDVKESVRESLKSTFISSDVYLELYKK